MFQARTSLPIVFADNPPRGSSALGAVSSKPNKDGHFIAYIPDVRTAYGRTVRLHEADHLTYSTPDAGKRRFITDARAIGATEDTIDSALQGFEDCFLGTRPVWQTRPTSVKRDAYAIALRELRTVKRDGGRLFSSPLGAPSTLILDRMKGHALNVMLRHNPFIAFHMAYTGSGACGPRAYNLVATICGQLRINLCSLNEITRLLRADNFAPARSLLLELIRPTLTPAPTFQEPDPIPEGDPDFEMADLSRTGFTGGSCSDVPVKLIKPALTAPTLTGTEGEPTESYSSCGYRIRRSALVPLGLGLPCSTPFIRTQEPTPGGVVIIDASGSMHVNADKLRRLASLAPASTVAYYSGGCEYNRNGEGYVVIYAQGGKRLDDAIPLPNLCDGNVADEQAILWAIREQARLGSDKPITLVSDLGFCGNSEDSKARAFALVEKGQRNGSLTVIDSVHAALASFSNQ